MSPRLRYPGRLPPCDRRQRHGGSVARHDAVGASERGSITTCSLAGARCLRRRPGRPPEPVESAFADELMRPGTSAWTQRRYPRIPADPRNARSPARAGFCCDGARGTRTPDLLGAIQALSQLSYSPVRANLAPCARPRSVVARAFTRERNMVRQRNGIARRRHPRPSRAQAPQRRRSRRGRPGAAGGAARLRRRGRRTRARRVLGRRRYAPTEQVSPSFAAVAGRSAAPRKATDREYTPTSSRSMERPTSTRKPPSSTCGAVLNKHPDLVDDYAPE